MTASLQVMKLALLLRRRRLLTLLTLLAVVPFLCIVVMGRLSHIPMPRPVNGTNDTAQRLLGTTPTPLSEEEKRTIYDQIRRLVAPPSAGPLKLKNSRRRDHSQHGQSRYVDDHLRQRRNGFFIESGASDGETGSNTLYFERHRNWTGLLIEANPQSYKALTEKQRHAYTLNACISPSRLPVSAIFKPAGGIGGLAEQMSSGHLSLVSRHGVGDINVTCYAINHVLAALNVSRVDYWSLDVEGAEMAILRSVDWNTMPRVDIISVEYKVKRADGKGDKRASIEKLEKMRQLLEDTGLYRQVGTKKNVDVIFARL